MINSFFKYPCSFFKYPCSFFKYPCSFFHIISASFSTLLFGYSLYYVKYDYDLILNTTKSQPIEKVLPYTEKYNKQYTEKYNKIYKSIPIKLFNFNISDEYLNQKINLVTSNYKQELIGLQQEYSELQNIYNNTDSDYDYDYDSDSDSDSDSEIIESKIIKIQSILKNHDLIIKEVKNICFQESKENFTKSLENNFILENTPIGNVIMVYNFNAQGFSYFSDKSISNKYLESVCKKYCIQFNCIPLFNNVFINNGKLSNFNFIKNEIKNEIKKNHKLSFADFKRKCALF